MADAPATTKVEQSAMASWTNFCDNVGLPRAPEAGIPDAALEMYCAYMAMHDKNYKYGTIRTYLSMGVRRRMLNNGLPDPDIFSRHRVQRILRGIRKLKGDAPNRKLAITPEILEKMLAVATSDVEKTAADMAILGFFTLLRKSNLAPGKSEPLHSRKHICREHFRFVTLHG
jgi:hypothetical protein